VKAIYAMLLGELHELRISVGKKSQCNGVCFLVDLLSFKSLARINLYGIRPTRIW